MALVEFNRETCTRCGTCIVACAGSIIIPLSFVKKKSK